MYRLLCCSVSVSLFLRSKETDSKPLGGAAKLCRNELNNKTALKYIAQ